VRPQPAAGVVLQRPLRRLPHRLRVAVLQEWHVPHALAARAAFQHEDLKRQIKNESSEEVVVPHRLRVAVLHRGHVLHAVAA